MRIELIRHAQDRPQGSLVGCIVYAKGAIQIDHMQPARTDSQPATRRFSRITAIRRLAGWVALFQPHDLPTTQVDGRVNREIAHPSILKKFSNIFNPTRWLFSGWNCTPKRFPRSTAQA